MQRACPKRTSRAPSLSNKALKCNSGNLVVRNSYLATKRISGLVEATSVRQVGEGRGWIGRIHRRTDVALGYGLRPREAAVVHGMVLGDRSLMPEDLETSFKRSGVTHALPRCGSALRLARNRTQARRECCARGLLVH